MSTETPLPCLLFCPFCAQRHVDEGEWRTRPHHTHRCAACSKEWRIEALVYGAPDGDLTTIYTYRVLTGDSLGPCPICGIFGGVVKFTPCYGTYKCNRCDAITVAGRSAPVPLKRREAPGGPPSSPSTGLGPLPKEPAGKGEGPRSLEGSPEAPRGGGGPSGTAPIGQEASTGKSGPGRKP